MSILIKGKGIEMPKEGNWTTIRIYPDGTCAIPNWQGDCTFIKDTKAIPVQPHGRLVDARYITSENDRFFDMSQASEEFDEHASAYAYSLIANILANAPTIISADPAEEGE